MSSASRQNRTPGSPSNKVLPAHEAQNNPEISRPQNTPCRTGTALVINHGCKLNQCEGEALAERLRELGFDIVPALGQADRGAAGPAGRSPDVVIVNTCTVTDRADRKSRNSIQQAARIVSPGGIVAVTGCYAQTDPGEILGIEGVTLVAGNDRKRTLADQVHELVQQRSLRQSCLPRIAPGCGSPPGSAGDRQWTGPGYGGLRSRAFLKVQDGCSMDCTYCKVPLARGKSVSRDPAGVLEEAQELVRQGCPELVLTGINLGSYSWRGTGLRALIEMLLKALPASCGIRLSSLESGFFDEPLLHLIESTQRIAPHFHLPLQSGSDRILKLMRRPCTTSRIAEQVKRIRGARPESHIALDVIVGFPTETEEDFKQTMLTVKRIEAASLHVFRYSPREGTKAALMHNDVSHREKMRRSKELIELGSDLNHRFRKRFQGEILWGVVEVSGSGAKCVTANYIKVRLAGLGEAGEKKPGCAENPVSGTKAPVLIEKVSVDSTWGRVVGRRESGLGHISSRQL